jgi:hypothetical protein
MFHKNSILVVLAISFVAGVSGPIAAFAAGPSAINLGSAGNFAVLAKTGISTTGSTSIVGDIGVSPAAASYITGFGLIKDISNTFSTSALVTGKIYAADYTVPAPTTMTTAISDMETAYTDGAGRTDPTETEMGAGSIGGTTLVPGLYKWSTNVTIPTDITLSGGPNDVWIFQIAGNLIMSSATHIVLVGGARAGNVFWIVAGQTTIGTTAVFNGNILDQTTIALNTGATLNGRALAQAAVTLDANAVTEPTLVVSTAAASAPATTAATSTSASTTATTAVTAPVTASSLTCSNLYWSDNTNATCQTPRQFCGTYMYQGLKTFTSQQDCLDSATVQTSAVTGNSVSSSSANTALQTQLNGLIATLNSLRAQASQQSSSVSDQIKAITENLGDGSIGDNVKIIQRFLISENKGPAAEALANVGATGYYGSLTYAAMAEFQTNAGLTGSILGDFGPLTRAYLSANY